MFAVRGNRQAAGLGYLLVPCVMLNAFLIYETRQKTSVNIPSNRALLDRSFSSVANSFNPVTDKIAHGYGLIYDHYFLETKDRPMKLLEIGLGCGMSYGPGASSLVWPELFPNGKIWFAEYEESCIKNYWNETSRFNYVVGDQSDRGVLEEWVAKTGGNFDYIIDDGGHTNPQIWNSFDVLFNTALKPEGVYFIEDLNVGRFDPWYADGLPTNNGSVVLDVLLDWADQLVTLSMRDTSFYEKVEKENAFPLPPSIARIDCIQDMCAVTKRR
ncbi:hypothetical protein Ndes2526B_g03933 [Nannochloris sp. 'desiccata']|nr:hypothetical protein KSW81_006102 [Chlorella desiccata (nom. nud.)]KAH7621076.1 putative Demethylmacrocin O-methyltransferase [Chlorella desiccata (nom. nud.)]